MIQEQQAKMTRTAIFPLHFSTFLSFSVATNLMDWTFMIYSCCPRSGGDDVRKPFDSTTTSFDTKYFVDLVNKMGNMMFLIGDGEIRMDCRVVNPS
ncbi:hypothetical protein NC653_041914 [Populus alba x Populus x berolinensis]|uniref:Peroxidase n=1 Tax=Populus alba x Populus x berolinensis TaxID=444605 RepID=A0AAD6PPW4_9ROSI|nr:hypothetical protein NC653_041914 [Populus alba x Populus x berolinensis]